MKHCTVSSVASLKFLKVSRQKFLHQACRLHQFSVQCKEGCYSHSDELWPRAAKTFHSGPILRQLKVSFKAKKCNLSPTCVLGWNKNHFFLSLLQSQKKRAFERKFHCTAAVNFLQTVFGGSIARNLSSHVTCA